MRITFLQSVHIRKRDGADEKVHTVSAKWESGDPSHATAHNYRTHADAERALRTYRYAFHQQ